MGKLYINPRRKETPFFSVIIATYNSGETLRESIESVISQAFDNFELIIIDGNSTDSTTEIVEEYLDKVAVYVSEPDTGIYNAWNKGIRFSKGVWICFIGSDDVASKSMLDIYHQAICSSDDQLDIVSSRIILSKDGRSLREYGQRYAWNIFRNYMNIAHVGAVHNAKIFEKYGYYDESYKICGDYELLLRAGKSIRADFVNAVTVTMSISGASTVKVWKALFEAYKAKRKNHSSSFVSAALHLIYGYTKIRIRKIFWY